MNVADRGQRLIAVDLENLVGCSPADATAEMYEFAIAELCSRLDYDPVFDRLIIGVNPSLALLAKRFCPTARIVTRPGPNGADIRLCRELEDLEFPFESLLHRRRGQR